MKKNKNILKSKRVLSFIAVTCMIIAMFPLSRIVVSAMEISLSGQATGTIYDLNYGSVVLTGNSTNRYVNICATETTSGSVTRITVNRDSSCTLGRTMGGVTTQSGKWKLFYVSGNTDFYLAPVIDGYNVSYNLNSGRVKSGSASTLSGRTTLPSSFPTVERTGYSFGGWYTNSAFTTSAIAGTSINSNVTIYAKWTAKSFTTTFDPCNTNASTVTTSKYDSYYEIPDAPQKDNYIFAGWYTATSGGSQIKGNTVVKTLENITFYAHWIENTVEAIKLAKYDEIDALTDLTAEQVLGYKKLYNDSIDKLVSAADINLNSAKGSGDDNINNILTELESDIDSRIVASAILQNEKNKACDELDEYALEIKNAISEYNINSEAIDRIFNTINLSLLDAKNSSTQGINAQTSVEDVSRALRNFKESLDMIKKDAEYTSYNNDAQDNLKNYAKVEKTKIDKLELTENQKIDFKELIDDVVAAKTIVIASIDIGENADEFDTVIPQKKSEIDIALGEAKTSINLIMSDVKVQFVKNAINGIGTVVCTNACKSDIAVARTAYDALNADQMNEVTAPIYKILTDAELKMKELESVKGSVNTDAIVAPTAPKAELAEPIDDLLSKVLDKGDLDLVNHGQAVNIYVEVIDASKVSTEDKKAVEEKLGEKTIGVFLDVNLWKQIGSEDAEKVTSTNGKIKIVITIPDEIVAKNGEDRIYQIIRVHDGVPIIIDGDYDAVNHTFTFETDKFSTYAVIYSDIEKVANTCDSTQIALTAIAALFSASAASFVTYKKKCIEE